MAKKAPSKKLLLLLNDKDAILSKVIANKLRKGAGWESVITTSFDEALKVFKEGSLDGVVTEILIEDHQGRNGFDLISVMDKTKGKQKVEIIIFTELRQENDKKTAKKLGVKHYFVKSEISMNELIDKLRVIFAD